MKKIISCITFVFLCTIFCFSTNAVSASETENALHVVNAETGNNTAYNINTELKGDISTEAYIPSELPDVTGLITRAKNARNVIGTDNRVYVSTVSSYPYTTMARIKVTHQDGSVSYGSGAMIGPRLVATAGHVLINNSLSHPASIQISFGLCGSYNYYSTTTYSSYIYYGNYQGYDPNTDYGFIQLSTNVGLTVTGYMGIRTACDLGQAIYATGYPGTGNSLYLCFGNVTSFTNELLVISADFTAGQSGGPIYAEYEGTPYLMGVISGNNGETNYGRRLDTGLYTWLSNNGYFS